MSMFIPIHDKILNNALIWPELTAVTDGQTQLSFKAMEAGCNRLSCLLMKLGIGKGSLVGIYMRPSARMVVTALAVLKSGAAYIPLSTAFPEERIQFILRDAGAGTMVSDAGPEFRNPFLRQAQFSPDWDAIFDPLNPVEQPETGISPEDLAYILYTSGSTGNPKGVMITHGNLEYYINWFCEHVIPESRVGLPLTSSFIFAAAVTQIYSTLLSGRTLHVLDPMLIRQPAALLQWYSENPGAGLYCVPTLWSEILRYLRTPDGISVKAPPPSVVYLSGESVSDELICATFERLPGVQLWNLYGPTEATANITACRLYPGDQSHIGTPLKGTRIFVADEALNPVKEGETGELLACGPGIAKGYINLRDLTDATFILNDSLSRERLRLYRSGDLVREEDGRLRFIGRKDQQVKIRGYRIELPEVERALGFPGIKHVVVKTVDDVRNGKCLVAYLMFEPGVAMPVDELRKMAGTILPDFMIPEIFVIMDRFPLLANGKTDRKSLPMPGSSRPLMGYKAVAPVTDAEKVMVRIWEEILGYEGLGMDDDFFDLGGNSLKANALVIEAGARLGYTLHLKTVFDQPTPARLMNMLAPPSGKVPLPAETQVNSADHGSLSFCEISENQKALWFLHQTEPGLAAYNIFYSLTLEGDLNVPALRQSINRLIVRHPMLISRFRLGGVHGIESFYADAGDPLWLKESPDGNSYFTHDMALADARGFAVAPFDLEMEKLFRFILYRTGDERYLLAMVIHHIIFDGLSFTIFIHELFSLYTGNASGKIAYTNTMAFSREEMVCEEKAYLSGQQYTDDKKYWKNLMNGVPTFFELPTDYLRPGTWSQEGGQVRRIIDNDLVTKLRRLSDGCGTSMFMTMLAAFSLLLFRHSGHRDFIIGTPVANRGRKAYLHSIGYFVNTLLFRVSPDTSMAFREWLAKVKDQVLESLAHARFPLSHMGVAMKTERIPGINTFFQVMFAFHEADWSVESSNGFSMTGKEEFTGLSKFDLYTEVFSSGQLTELVITYSASLYRQDSIDVLADHFITILESVSRPDEQHLEEINLMSAQEYEKVILEWNRTYYPEGPVTSLPALIREQVRSTPELTALASSDKTYSYSGMYTAACSAASNLIRKGLRKGDPVGIHMENSPEMVISIIGVMMAGGIYIPLDPYYPPERLKFVIERTGIRFLITDQKAGKIHDLYENRVLHVQNLLIQGCEEHTPSVFPNGNDLAYILFTSGSTGSPKGVMIRHSSLLNFLVWVKREIAVSTDDVFLSTTSINFDISILELFLPLVSGGRLVLHNRSELQAPENIGNIMNSMCVTTLQFVPSGFKALCESGVLARATYLNKMIAGGEKLSKSLQDAIFDQSGAELFNMYGPTEATVYMASWRCIRNSRQRMVPIGKPISNAAFYILDEHLKPVPIGVSGEAYIGGQVLAAGYFLDEVQTSLRFLPDPFSPEKGAKMYRTGDLCRFQPDGSIEFLGRTDHQVKVRGFRIELGEVEATILRFPGVKSVVVDAQEHGNDDIRLTAFIIPENRDHFPDSDLKDFLRLYLPSYMIPGHIITAPALPILPNGKTDRKALMALRPDIPAIPRFNHTGTNETEEQLKTIWRDILGHEAFGISDNFFEVGGHSLLLVRMKDLIGSEMKVEVTLVDLFHFPTIQSLASSIRREKPVHIQADIIRRVEMRNRAIRQQIGKRIIPGNKPM